MMPEYDTDYVKKTAFFRNMVYGAPWSDEPFDSEEFVRRLWSPSVVNDDRVREIVREEIRLHEREQRWKPCSGELERLKAKFDERARNSLVRNPHVTMMPGEGGAT
jgi:hypothetical protein